MRLGTLVGLVLIVLGIVGLAAGGFSFTHKEKVLDIGPVHATADKKESVPISPILGTAAIVGGVLLVAATSRRRS
jgi:drug/metabolite transporter (DMT)-like permease